MDIGSDLYFHIMNQNWPGMTRDPPPRGGNHPKNWKNTFWVMWHINRKPMKSSIQICFFQGSMSTPNEIRSWFSSWILVLTYIFISWTKIGRGWHVTPPGGVTTPKIKKTCLWSCDISIESPWKALFKYVNWMLIWPLIRPSADENDRKIVLL